MANLYENDYYTVVQGHVYVDESRSVPGYHAVSKRTQVVEYEDTILPQVIGFANGAAEHLDDLLSGPVLDKVNASSH